MVLHRKNKLLVTTSTFWRWKGDVTPPFVYDLSKRLAKDFDVWVLAPHSKGAARSERIDEINIFRYYYFPAKHEKLCEKSILPNLKSNPWLWLQVPSFLVAQLFAIRKIAKSCNIDIIHAHWIIPQGLLAVLYRLLFNPNIKILVTSHGGDIFGLRFWPMPVLKKWVLNNIDSMTVVSKAIKDEVLALGIRKDLSIHVVPMGVDLSQFSPECYREDIKKQYGITGPFLLFVGRLSEKKGVEYLINAMPSILLDFPGTKLLIIGEGENEITLKTLSQKLGVEKFVIFVGTIKNKDLPQYYATADIFVGPSVIANDGDREGLPVTYMEATASGCILLGTDLEGNKDIIENGKTGFMIKQKDSIQIAEKVRFILSNKSDLSDMRVKARETTIKKFDWSIISEIYKQILSRM